MKTLTFFSNYYNHHQKALCEAFYELLGDGFTFVETMPMEGFRSEMGWGEGDRPYLLKTYLSEENHKRGLELGLNSDLVIMGTAPEEFIEERLKENRITFRYSERPLKEGFIKFFIPRLTKKYLHIHVKNRKKPIYILGASAFTSLDYKKMFKSYNNKCYKFGYFPEHKVYDIDELMKKKEELAGGKPTILWMGRMLKLKHPELVVKALSQLKAEGYDFSLKIVGEGEMRGKVEKLIEKGGLKSVTSMCDFLKPDEARDVMSEAQIYVMTSNKLEGWGSVIYEALNAGCAEVASHICGATPWLIKDGTTGLIFKSESVKSLKEQLKKLLDSKELTESLGRCAYENMHEFWNPEEAAKRVIGLYEYINDELSKMSEEEKNSRGYAVEGCPYEDGPCSVAEYLKNDWI